MKKIVFIDLIIIVIFLISGCGNKIYEPGTEIYFNPETGKKCNNYKEENSQYEVRSGCMKWYVFDDNGDGTVDMILDHNIGSTGVYSVIEKKLIKLTENWNQQVSSTARLIGADEIAKITGNTEFDVSTSEQSAGFYFEGNKSLGYLRTQDEVIEYHWLFDNLALCKMYGCAVQNANSPTSYSTNTLVAKNSSYVWIVNGKGTLEANNIILTAGIRPVITVSKSKI